jgi:hypothetical protein
VQFQGPRLAWAHQCAGTGKYFGFMLLYDP